jgi:hypothetical protein
LESYYNQTLVKNSHLKVLCALILIMAGLLIAAYSQKTEINITSYRVHPCEAFCLVGGTSVEKAILIATGSPLIFQTRTLICSCVNGTEFSIDVDRIQDIRPQLMVPEPDESPECIPRSNTERTT